MKATTKVERTVLVSETTERNGITFNRPTFDWEPTDWNFFVAAVRATFNEESAERVIEDAQDPNSEDRTDDGWFHVRVTVKRHGVVGRFAGSLRVNLG